MQRIFYASGSIVTGDAIAAAVLDYAAALARGEQADVVRFPVFLGSGEFTTTAVLIGPASQLMCVREPAEGVEELVDDELVAELRARAAVIGVPQRAAPETPGSLDVPEDFG